ncbi:MAG TPA: transglycosylase SLT domain-containing protein [Paludibacter sp.]|nr:transglycosylase SLT domain-containing protein [Paludibacter sp.]
MTFKTLFYIGLFLITGVASGYPQKQASKNKVATDLNTETDTTLSVPADFDNTLDYMLKSWVIQRSKNPDCESGPDQSTTSDSIYKLRLSKMPCLMEMPYNPTVRSFIELYTVRKRKQVEYLLGMSEYYFPIFEQVLGANNLPLELKYLTIIESALNTTIVSRMGAAGLWQLMIGTGRMYGLEINSLVDERLSPVKATNAAARFLKDLYSIYGDWNLVIASYNCGPGNVNKAIRRAGGKRDYWAIYPYLPKETRGYVPIFIAANYSLHYARKHNLCPAQVNMPALTDTVMVHRRIHLEQIANVLNLPLEEVRLLNPQYKKDIIPGDIKPYALSLPLNYTNSFLSKYDEVVSYKADSLIYNRRNEIEIPQTPTIPLGGSSKVIYHKVKRGQTLSDVADKYGIPLKKLKKWNMIRGSRIKAGQKLKILK